MSVTYDKDGNAIIQLTATSQRIVDHFIGQFDAANAEGTRGEQMIRSALAVAIGSEPPMLLVNSCRDLMKESALTYVRLAVFVMQEGGIPPRPGDPDAPFPAKPKASA